MRRATRSAAKASPTSATCSSCRTPASSAISKPRSWSPITPSIGAGPLEFFADAGKTGLELSALSRINELYAARASASSPAKADGRSGSSGTARRSSSPGTTSTASALGDPAATIRGLAAKEGITGRFAEHIWTVVNKPNTGYPTRETVDGWTKLPAPTSDVTASIAKARAGCDELYKALTTWPSWFFARGDLAAGGAGDESPLVVRRHDAEGRAGAPLHLRDRHPRAAAAAAPRLDAGPVEGVPDVHRRQPGSGRDAGRHLAEPADRHARRGAGGRGAAAACAAPRRRPPAAGAARRRSCSPRNRCASVLPPMPRRRWRSARVRTARAIGPDDFATTGTVSFTIDVPAGGNVLEFQADAELGNDRNAVVRVTISDRPEGSPRDAAQRVILGDPQSAGYETFRANIAEYVALLPPNSHGEANPADKDPVPPPFDNTYNSPEHDAFVLKVKYQRNDRFFTENMVDGADRARLNQAWNDLFGSWPYHDAYLGMLADHYGLKLKSRHIQDLDAAAIAALPAAVRPHVTSLRAHYDEVTKAQALAQPGHVTDALAFASRAWRRPLTAAEKSEPARVLPEVPHREPSRSRRGDPRAAGARPGVAGVPLSRGDRRARSARGR